VVQVVSEAVEIFAKHRKLMTDWGPQSPARAQTNRQSLAEAPMTREKQITTALKLLNPTLTEREQCRLHIEEVLNVVEAAGKAADHARATKERMHRYSAALRYLHQASSRHVATGGALAVPLSTIAAAVASDAAWSAHWSPPSRWVKEETATALSYELLTSWNPGVISQSAGAAWDRLAGVLCGKRGSLYRHLRNFAARTPNVDHYRRRVRERRLVIGEDKLLQRLRERTPLGWIEYAPDKITIARI
jgi:hypothetical protein